MYKHIFLAAPTPNLLTKIPDIRRQVQLPNFDRQGMRLKLKI
jgi:hypothetical protein